MINYKAIGKMIRKNRIDCKLTQENLAELVDVSTDYISKIENAKKRPSLLLLDEITSVLDMDLWTLFYKDIHWDNSPTSEPSNNK